MASVRVTSRLRAFTRNNLRVRTGAIIAGAMRLEEEYAEKLIAMLQYTPPERPEQKYVRTGELIKHWKINPGDPRVTPSGIICRVINDVKDDRGKYYATYVQGPWQTAMHAGRWIKAESGVESGPADDDVMDLRRDFARDMRRLVRNNIGYV